MPLQKSFLESNQSGKVGRPSQATNNVTMLIYVPQQRQRQWSRNKSFQGQQTSKQELPLKPLQEKPPIPVSTTTKNKLSDFQFRGQSKSADKQGKGAAISLLSDDEKENHHKETTRRQHSSPKKSSRNQETPVAPVPVVQKPSTRSSPSLPAATSRNDLPSTPNASLALPDLIGMEDVRLAVQDITPEDRIEWDQRSSQSAFIRRAKKRARSSSPLSSPAANALNSRESSKSQVDPGFELWGRYSSNSATPQGTTMSTLAHMIHTSSPQPSREGTTPRSVGGFRRTISCGTQFPKRRRVGGNDGDDVFTESVNIGPSKLSVLIERVQEGLSQAKPSIIEKQASPSRLPKSHVAKTGRSPRRRAPEPPLENLKAADSFDTISDTTVVGDVDKASDGSDYEDQEFDDAELDDASVFDSLLVQSQLPTSLMRESSNSKLPPDPPPAQDKPALRSHQLVVGNTSGPLIGAAKDDDDEFGDSDEELFAAGLDDMVANFSTQIASKEAPNTGIQSNKKVSKADSDDEFGDDLLDDVDFQEVEMAATQSIQHTFTSHPSVRPNIR